MKLALLGTINHFGGGPKVILELAKRLSKEHEVDIITDFYEKEKAFKEFENFNIKVLNPLNIPLIRRYTLAKKWLNYDLSEHDACISNTFYSNLASLKNRKVFVYIQTTRLPIFSLNWSTYRGAMKFIDFLGYLPLKKIEKEAVKKAKVIANSYFVKEKIDKYYGVSCDVLHPGVSASEFYSKPSEDFCIYVGRIDPSKRLELIIQAWNYVEGNLKLQIIGEGKQSYVEYLRSIRTKNVYWAGPLEGEKLREMYARCLCTIYVPKEEDFGMVALEAMASSKPVIAADEGGLKEIVRDKLDGFLVDPVPKNIAEKVNFLNKNRSVAEEMGKNARKRAIEFDWDKQAERLVSFIKDSLKRH